MAMKKEDDVIDAFASCLSDQCKRAGLPKYKMALLLDRRKSYVSEITGGRRQQYMRTLPLWMVKDMAKILDERGADGALLLRHAYTYISLREAA